MKRLSFRVPVSQIRQIFTEWYFLFEEQLGNKIIFLLHCEQRRNVVKSIG